MCSRGSRAEEADNDDGLKVFDAHGTQLDGRRRSYYDLKLKVVQWLSNKGTRETDSIRLQEGDHNIACRVDGQAMNLKSEFMKKRNSTASRCADLARNICHVWSFTSRTNLSFYH